jgi:calcineurin-like phosphoesterase
MAKICLAENCDKIAYGKGYCRPHWHRLRTYGRLEKIRGLIKGNCTIEGCTNSIKGLGFCKNHYFQFKKYGIHPNDYLNKLKEQNYVCAICGEAESSLFWNNPDKIKKLAVDHSHETGKVRGLLCWRCNSILGRVNEDVDLINKMIDYLKKHGE